MTDTPWGPLVSEPTYHGLGWETNPGPHSLPSQLLTQLSTPAPAHAIDIVTGSTPGDSDQRTAGWNVPRPGWFGHLDYYVILTLKGFPLLQKKMLFIKIEV